jgi:hypothetical protein
VEVADDQALAFRVAGHHLDRRVGASEALAAFGLQEYPPVWGAAAALRARSEEPMPDDAIQVNAFRGAPYFVPRADARVFTAALVPEEAELKALVGPVNSKEARDEGFAVPEALQIVVDAARDGLADGPLERDDFHQALRERLPPELLWWCRGCRSHHVHPLLWRATGVMGVLAVAERRGRVTVFGAPPKAPRMKDAPAELARRFLRAYGPATRTELAAWAGIAPAHARALLAEIEDEVEGVDLAGRRAVILAADTDRLASPPAAAGVRLLGGYDAYLDQRDRDTLLPDPGLRKRVRRPLGNPGVVLVKGQLAGLWRPEKKGKRLVLNIEPIAPAARRAADEVEAEAAVVAANRGCSTAEVAWV